MTIYEHRAVVTVASGTASTYSLNIPGGIVRQLIVRALTDTTTTFAVNMVDDFGDTIKNYGYNERELNDDEMSLAVAGTLAINLTNASPTDTFRIKLKVEE